MTEELSNSLPYLTFPAPVHLSQIADSMDALACLFIAINQAIYCLLYSFVEGTQSRERVNDIREWWGTLSCSRFLPERP